MSTRYGRRAADGTMEYHDDKESLIAAEHRENKEGRAGLFGLIGLLVGGVLIYVALLKLGADLPKWARFAGVIVGAGVGAYTLAKLADLIWSLIMLAILLGVVYGVGTLVWRAL